ncbi:NAD(P)/FAD-dependent oxidoreductase [Algoriphagus halophytocola]|uniref:FAD-binding oxidoreductase n=1 Tax=Algoriphagus halophytocola TaxID=2991499 RepID=A0ABY6MMB8_9BACT|nr:FAD-binding oxidoreductase [Algoriphagus sp. TR-M5]UZD24295.1 FAD-binding oxidoreductase [Algoriphagus sp. TR-M5]
MLSYWEKKHFFNYDLIVVGAGFVGLSTAIHFQQKHPKAKVVVLERGVLPTGASTKNAGFACFGSLTEILDDLKSMTQDEVLDLVRRRYKGLEAIRKEFGDKGIGYKHTYGFELLDRALISDLDQLEGVNSMLRVLFTQDVFSKVKKVAHFGFSPHIEAIVKNKFEGELDPGTYLDSLWKKAQKSGAKILTGITVEAIQDSQGLAIAKDGAGEKLEFSGQKIAVCTNAFSKKLLPELDLEPGRGLVLLSKPLEFEIPWKGTFHMDKGYVYFRQIDGRLLLGGARNLDFGGERTLDFAVNEQIRTHLQQLANEVVFPGKSLEWEMQWTGIMAFGSSKTPLIQPVGTKTAIAVRLGGMGVAVGYEVGRELSGILGKM